MIERRFSITKTKLIPPQLKNTFLYRPLLMKKLNQIHHYRLSLIHTGPGFGKSSMLSAYLHSTKKRFCWYSLTHLDESFTTFIVHLIYAFKELDASFVDDLLSFIMTEEINQFEDELDYICSLIVNEILQLKENIIFILDDVHLAEKSSLVNRWLQLFIENAPPNLHLVLLGRIRPTWDCITRMLLHNELLELSKADFAFSKEEIDVLFQDMFHVECQVEELDELYQLTEGWIIALQMVGQLWKTNGKALHLMRKELLSSAELFRFLSLEAFSRQDEHVQSFLLCTSIVEDFDVEFCEKMFNILNAEKTIEYLMNQNLFISEISEKHYRYHSLFRDFLMKQLKEDDHLAINCYLMAANYYLEIKDFEKAIDYYLQAEQYEKAAILLEQEGISLLKKGKMENIQTIVTRLPETIRKSYPNLWFLEGEINRYYCKYETAENCYRNLEEVAREALNDEGISLSMEGQAKIYLDTIQPAKANYFLEMAIKHMEKILATKERKLFLYSLMTENLVNLGKTNEVEQWLAKIRLVDPAYENVEVESRYYLRTGQLFEAKERLKAAKLAGQEENMLSRSHREIELLLSLVFAFIGEGQSSKKLAEEGIMSGIERKSPFVEACGWIRFGHAVQIFDARNLPLAIQCYETALNLMTKINMSRGKSEAYMGLCLLYGRTGEFDKAMRFGKMALEEPTRVKDRWFVALVHLSMGIAAYHNERSELAIEHFEVACTMFIECGGKYGKMISLFWLSLLYYEKNEVDKFIVAIDRCLTLLDKHSYQFFIHRKTLFGPIDLQKIPPLLLQARELGIQHKLAAELLALLRFEHLTSHPGYSIRVQTLGEFNVWLGNERIDDKAWKRDKAKELFQLFLANQKRLFTKEELLSMLWNGQDEESASRDLKVALNALNKAIEPHRKARSSPFFIVREENMYGLNRDANMEVDFNSFTHLIENALGNRTKNVAKELLIKGLSLYKGDFLPNRRFDDWSIELRERLLVLFLRGAERLAQIYCEEEQFDEAIVWCEKILLKDSCWEEAYRMLMYCFYRKNNRSQGIRVYKKCQQQLNEELGVEPLVSTKELFELIHSMETRHPS